MMKEIGQKLKDAREKKGYSIQDVSIAIKINTKTLQAIEDGDTDLLPAKPFLRGFVQTYTKYLDMNVDDVMRVFTEELGTTKPKTHIDKVPMSETIETTDEAQKKFDLYKKIGFATAALFAVILVYVIQRIVVKYEKEHQTAESQKSAISTETATPASSEAESSAPQTPEATVASTVPSENTINSESTTLPLATKASTPSQELTELKNTTTTPAINPPATKPASTEVPPLVAAPETNLPKPATPVTVTPVTAPVVQKPIDTAVPPKETPKVESATTKKSPQSIVIEALDSVEIRFQKDGEPEKTLKLKPEQIVTLQADYKVSISINDGGAVSIIRNGKDLGVPGSLGKPSKLNYP